MQPTYLKSYSALETFREYLQPVITALETADTHALALEQLVALMGLVASGYKSTQALDHFYANDYFKLSLNLKHYQRFEIAPWLAQPQVQAYLQKLAAWDAQQPSRVDSIALSDFEEGRFNQALQPVFNVVQRYLQHYQAQQQAHTDDFQYLPFSADMHGRFLRDGYLVIENFLRPEQLQAFRDITQQLAQQALDADNAYLYGNDNRLQRVYNLLNKHAMFRDLLSCKTIQGILNTVFDRDTLHQKFYLSSFQANILNPGAEAQKLHVDSSVPDPLPPWLIRVNVNVLLDDFTENNGATLVLPGSHLFLKKPTPSDQPALMKVLAPAGSIVMWTGHLWHKSGENSSQQPRTALLACLVASYLREVAVEENYLQVMSAENIARSPKILRDMLGVGHGIKQGA